MLLGKDDFKEGNAPPRGRRESAVRRGILSVAIVRAEIRSTRNLWLVFPFGQGRSTGGKIEVNWGKKKND
jgi:hypothetical protein